MTTRDPTAAGEAAPGELPDIRPEAREVYDGFGRAVRADAVAARPGSVAEARALLQRARLDGVPVAPRGSGRSYGDAALNERGIVLEMRGLNRVLDWNPDTGVIEVEPGVTIEELWRHTLPDGWWPPVVSGTMFPTLGSCVAANIHGQNNFGVGPLGDHVLDLDLLTPDGETLRCSRREHPEIFRAVIGGFGLLGLTTRLRIGMKRVTSGYLRVEGLAVGDLDALFDAFEARLDEADYLVGWVDCFARGRSLGRAVVHRANYIGRDEDPEPDRSLSAERQVLPDRFFGVVPRGMMWRLMRPWVNDPGMRLVNLGKYLSSVLRERPAHTYLQSHVGFAFLLDYVPRWRECYGEAGFIQVQPFVPADRAREVFRRILEHCQRRGIVPYLGVFKRHRADEFLISHGLDGYSLALDIPIRPHGRDRVWALGRELGDLVVEAGGSFYFAKDAVARPDQVEATFGRERLDAFADLKRRLDPEGVLSTTLSRRVFPELPVVG